MQRKNKSRDVYRVMGRNRQLKMTEVVDEAGTEKEARYLLQEYRMAFGPSFDLWIEGL